MVEVDETFFLESSRGQRQLPRPPRQGGGVGATRGTGKDQILVIVARDREGHTADFKLDRLDAVRVQAALQPLVDAEAVLCADGAAVYSAFARRQGGDPSSGAGQTGKTCTGWGFPHSERECLP